MPSVAAPLIDYLRQLEAKGQTHVTIDDNVRPILREFFLRAKNLQSTPALSTKAKPKAVAEPPNQPPFPRQKVEHSNEQKSTRLLEVDGATKAQKIKSLKKLAETWQAATSLDTLRKTMVFSTGNPDADVMLIGEAPGFDEERLLEPFVGKAGQKLDGILVAMGIDRKETYISNIVKFRPSMPNQTTNNRKPTQEEMVVCLPFIEKEVEIVQPKVIIALGGTAAQGLLGCQDTVGKMRGTFHQYQGISLRVTYHPSYILHNEATSEKRKIWEDMLAVMELLSMPVSDKQRGYFLPKS